MPQKEKARYTFGTEEHEASMRELMSGDSEDDEDSESDEDLELMGGDSEDEDSESG